MTKFDWMNYNLKIFRKYYGLNIIDLSSCFFTKEMDHYNNMVIYIELFIALRVLVFVYVCFVSKYWQQNFRHWVALELIWTVFPIVVLLFLGLPSLKILYITEIFNFTSSLNLKVTGHQWYWEYRIPEFIYNLDSYPFLDREYFRLGECDLLVLPFNCKIRSLMTSYDVLHSWALPSLGFKIDACPGRINFFIFISHYPRVHIGQCSELCGAYHSWIPIIIEFTSISLFLEWIKLNIE